ncbi:hypothetical protein CDL12_03868 [Handroanthus impetiginosus]|uniref:EGF-like domain-containing protein n=1 Tax=Handroanthus impetiginosus TaxID=429701 RepID=A0A2G9I0X0_9LAMI|nr:hypothetical protein CDL12_03868 [Handroanthus impetiginosus]
MANFSNFAAYFLAILLVLLPISAKGNDIPPSLSPFYEGLCNEVECGRGSCEAASNYPFGFRCNCENGWKRTRFDDEENLEFLPCIIPNCSLDYSCMPAAPPVPPVPHNRSFFDPCYWIYCGEGTCTKNRTYTHTCQCNPGYSNLLNISAFPCYRDCALGSESCERLGIRVANSNANPSSDKSNQAMAFSVGKFNWMAILLMTASMFFLK